MIIREATYNDLERINEIYNQAVVARQTGDMLPVLIEERKKWFDHHLQDGYPVFVAEQNGETIGWLSFSSYRGTRQAFRHTAEISYYIHKDHQRQGIGKALIEYALKIAPSYNFKNLVAIILETNTPSLLLLDKFSFERWAYLPKVADFDGEGCGHVYYGINL